MPLLHANEPSVEGAIEVTSTSRQTARADDIPLRPASDQTRLFFEPTIVDNGKVPENSVSGKLIYEKKGKDDPLFPSQRGEKFVSKRTVKKDDALQISLKTSEVRALYLGLQALYELYGDIGGIQSGTAAYVRIDETSGELLQLLRSGEQATRLMANPDAVELVKEFLNLITQSTSLDRLKAATKELGNGSINRLSSAINLEMLKRAANEMRVNLDNQSESHWQSAILEKHPWIISLVFATPCVLFQSKAYVGGKTFDNSGGHEVDFLYKNALTNNTSIVEIKTPCTRLLGSGYRNGCYSVSSELSGAVSQALTYKQSFLNNLMELRSGLPERIEAFNPKCVIIIGNLAQLKDEEGHTNASKLSSFENFRNALNGITVVTFDELLQRVEDLIGLFETHDEPAEAVPQEYDDNSWSPYENWEDPPF